MASWHVFFFLTCDPGWIRQPRLHSPSIGLTLCGSHLVCSFKNTLSLVAIAIGLPWFASPNLTGPRRQQPSGVRTFVLPKSTSPGPLSAGAPSLNQQRRRSSRTRGLPRRHSLPVQNPRGCPKRLKPYGYLPGRYLGEPSRL